MNSLRTTCTLVLTLLATGLVRGDGDALVIVNGRSISEERIHNLLMEAYGLEVMQQVIITELARQATRDAGLTVTPADVRAERLDTLNRIAAEAGLDPEEATDENKEKALDEVLKNRRISMTEFLIGMERNAHLRKLVESTFEVDEPTLRAEFGRTHGERVRIRHIQVGVQNAGRMNEVVTLLQEGTDFADVARQMSVNVETAPRGGELPAFSFTDERFDPLLREAAFSLDLNEVSNPVRTGQFYHILKLEERIPPAAVRFEDVRSQVEASLRERVIPDQMGDLAQRLFNQANIKVIDPKMRSRYEDFLKKN